MTRGLETSWRYRAVCRVVGDRDVEGRGETTKTRVLIARRASFQLILTIDASAAWLLKAHGAAPRSAL
eukprot:scaffold2971_cov274-Pinguiococcus_pyrenoidosus.AAC.6